MTDDQDTSGSHQEFHSEYEDDSVGPHLLSPSASDFENATTGRPANSIFYSMRGSLFDPYQEATAEEDAEAGAYSIEDIDLDESTHLPRPISSFSHPYNTEHSSMSLLPPSGNSSRQHKVADVYAELPSRLSSPPGAILPGGSARRESMTETLLPAGSSRRSAPSTTLPFIRDTRYRDPLFLLLYLLATAAFLLSAPILLLSTHSPSSLLPSSFFSILTDRLALIAVLLLVSFALGALWLVLLQNRVRLIVKANAILLPPLLFLAGAWMMVEAFASPAPAPPTPHWPMVFAAAIPLLGGPILGIYARRRWHRLERSVTVLELSLTILRDNPDLIAISLLLTGVWSIFSSFWIILFSRIALIGSMPIVIGRPPSSIASWDLSTWVLSIGYVAYFFWTAGLLNDLQRITTARVVSDWYFHRHDSPVPPCGRATPALLTASTHQLGTASLAALTLSLSRAVQLSSLLIRRLARFSIAVIFLQGIARYLTRSTAGVSALAPSYAGVSGLPFCASAMAISRTLRRNVVLLNLHTDAIIRLIFYWSSLLLATLAALTVYTVTLAEPSSPSPPTPTWGNPLGHTFLVAALTGAVQFFVARFYSRSLSAITDAAFLCWTIDLDEQANRCPEAHQAFAPGYSDHVLA